MSNGVIFSVVIILLLALIYSLVSNKKHAAKQKEEVKQVETARADNNEGGALQLQLLQRMSKNIKFIADVLGFFLILSIISALIFIVSAL